MGEFIHDSVCEQILVRLDVEDLIRCKSVCKSWKSLISHPHFVKAHHTRQVNLIPNRMAIIPNYLSKYGPEYYMVGSSNGVACINSFNGDEIIVANPWTREERIILKPKVSNGSCWGFGYDSLRNDYKVVLGVSDGLEKTHFQVLSLKSNVWKHVGLVNYIGFGVVQIGPLCNGVLQWVMFSVNRQRIISFDLSKEVFKEIYKPGKAIRECSLLDIKQGYLCIFNCRRGNLWGTEKYSVKLYWENSWRNFYALSGSEYKEPYAFIPTTVMPSLISPYFQEGND